MLERLRARARHPRPAADDGALAGRVLRRPRGGRERPADRRRRAVLRAAPRHLHVAGARSSGATAARRARCTTPSCWPRWPGDAVSARGARAAVADAAAQPVPRHPPRLARSHEVNVRARADLAEVVAGRRRDLRARCWAAATSRSTRGRSRAARSSSTTASRCWSPCRRAARARSSTARRRCARRAARRRRGRARQRAPDRGHRPRRHGHAASSRDGREALVRARQPLRALRGPADRLGRVGRRPGAPRDARGRPARRRHHAGSTSTRCAPRSSSSAAGIAQNIRLDAGSRRLEFHTDVDWRGFDHKLLKVAFPLAVRATDATYEVAFGAVQRPTHYSSRADLARYEVPGHRWADLSEHGFGVAVLTDSKYGYSAFGDTLRISLLRAPRNPDREADRGLHTFAYALLPHAGSWQDAGVVEAGDRVQLADPLGRARARLAGERERRPRARHGQAGRGLRRARPAPVRAARRARRRAGARPGHGRAPREPARAARRARSRSRTARSSCRSDRGRSSP